jgi:hypothetical protein
MWVFSFHSCILLLLAPKHRQEEVHVGYAIKIYWSLFRVQRKKEKKVRKELSNGVVDD